MKCKVCGAESGKYPLCRVCNSKKENGEIIKCSKCGNCHYAVLPCYTKEDASNNDKYLYEAKNTLISKNEQSFYIAIKAAVPEGFCVFPQINLAAFIERNDNARFHNELFRNVDFLVTDSYYKPKVIVEINDKTHFNQERRERDEKVSKICEEAGIPIVKLWTSYGVNPEYIKNKIDETLNKLPINRIHHFSQTPSVPLVEPEQPTITHVIDTTPTSQPIARKKRGCYIATCVYGSYDCPSVWILRRYRDNVLSKTILGKLFIKAYYLISPSLVRIFGKQKWFRNLFNTILDKLILKLKLKGIESSPYKD